MVVIKKWCRLTKCFHVKVTQLSFIVNWRNTFCHHIISSNKFTLNFSSHIRVIIYGVDTYLQNIYNATTLLFSVWRNIDLNASYSNFSTFKCILLLVKDMLSKRFDWQYHEKGRFHMQYKQQSSYSSQTIYPTKYMTDEPQS